MSNISVTTTQNVIEVTQTSGITVTTPEGQTINVEVPNSSVNVTNTTDDITITEVGITNTDQLIEGTTNLFFTNARARAAISLTTDDTSILDYNSTTGVFTWDTPTTTKIAEGTNQYFTQARARQSLSAGTGISYDNSTGVITNTSINTDTTYTIDAATATGGANLTLTGSDSSTDSVKFASGTNITISRTDANTITIDGTDTNTTYTQNASSTTGGANLNLVGSDSSTDTIKFASGTNITVSRTDANTITIDGSDLNTTYTIASASTSGGANLTLTGSDSSTDSVAYLGAGATTVTSTDANTVTITSTDTNTTYTQNASSTSGGANLNLVGSDSTTDSIKLASGTNVTVTRTDADTVTISSTDTNTTYTVDATATSGGANLNLTGSDSSTDSVAYLGSGATTITRTDANTITVSSTDTNTTYTQNISSTTGGANLNLVGSDSTTDTVKFANGTGVTVAYTDADTATISIGQSVGTGDSPSFAGGTFGNITVGVATDQTISTTSGDLILDSNSGTVSLNVPTITTDATTLTLFNTTATTVNAFGAATTVNIGTGNTSVLKGSNRSPFTSPTIAAFQGSTAPSRGLLLNNGNGASAALARNTLLIRTYPVSGSARGQILFEQARGTETTPAAVQTGDLMAEINATGYATNGYIVDYVTAVPALSYFTPTETWANTGGPYPTAGTVTNAGTGYILTLQPTATNLTAASRINVLAINPQTFAQRSDAFTWANGKTGTTQTMALDVSGNLTITSDLRVNGNDIKGGGGLTAINLSNTNSNLNLISNTIDISNSTGTGGAVFSMSGTGTTGGIYARMGDVNITQFESSWQSVFTPGFKYTGLASSSTLTNNGTAFEMSSRWKASAGTSTFDPPQTGWGIGAFQFSADNSTNNTSQILAGQIRCVASENWTSTAAGTRMTFDAIKSGTLSGIQVLDMSPTSTTFRSDAYNFQDSNNVDIPGGKIDYRRTFGAFNKVADVTAAAADTVYAFDWTNNTTTVVNTQGITISNTSRINFDAAGDYNVVIEMVGKNVDNADRTAYVWLAKNGTDIAETAIKLVLTKDTTTMLSKDWLVNGIAANDYLEVRFAVDTTVSGISLEYTAAQTTPYVRPSVPSATIFITPVGA